MRISFKLNDYYGFLVFSYNHINVMTIFERTTVRFIMIALFVRFHFKSEKSKNFFF